ncbi:MAG TPA: peptide ABC transporter permease, partial [Gammaproteobacteria bacterium]
MTQLTNIVRLSFRDYSHEWRMSGCFVLALASVLAPMMILFGLKFGIVSSMVQELVENPDNR